MKLRSFFIALGIAVAVLLLLSATTLSWILGESSLSLFKGGVTREPIASLFVSRQAPVMISLLVNPERLESFSQYIASVANRRRSRQELKDLEKTLLANTGLNYDQEIKPWLGEEITLAVTSLDYNHNPTDGVQPGYLLAVATKDPQLAKEFLQVSYSKKAIAGTSDLVFNEYKGINIVDQRSSKTIVSRNFTSSAVVGNFVLFANEAKILRNAINNAQVPDLNLKNSPTYQDSLKTISDPRIGVVYANLPALSAWIGNLPVPETPEALQTLSVALSIKSEGIVAQTALIGVTGEENQPPALSELVSALGYVPANSMLAAAGTNLDQLWQQVETGLDEDSPLQQLFKELLNRFQEPLGLNLPKDVFSWVKGEYSLALVPSFRGGQPDLVFIAERMPDVEIAPAIAHLDELAVNQGYSVIDLPIQNTKVKVWTKLIKNSDPQNLALLNAIVKGVHATITQGNQYEIFTSSVAAMEKILSDKQTIMDSRKFQQAISALPTDNDGYFYIDWNEIQPLLEQKLPIVKVAEFAVKPFFKNLRSLTLSSQGSENGVRRATVFLNLGVRK
ncbi:hypothetical protein C7H19_20950 [Aphanothece hegewaldii CCALA 016]|uniref:DUF3352 domain-containing protein n=1 Tax=Aphanothece hegewaldii CCALA 016 TaxID=2107694 RepID=A0A2T1LSN3_9CHRO|nr:DUF3352 domain-containing protein [Aphanothece hegewaldii]PSF33069.1 hypothetical protein C7H19_20950 [Aphanothece hegewaldii CCALA 016]